LTHFYKWELKQSKKASLIILKKVKKIKENIVVALDEFSVTGTENVLAVCQFDSAKNYF